MYIFFLIGDVSTTGFNITSITEVASLTCEFSGYLPGDYDITWMGPEGAVPTSSGRHAISTTTGTNQSQSGGDSPGLSVLSTLTISDAEETDVGTYFCTMVGNNDVQLSGSAELNTSIDLSRNDSTTTGTCKHHRPSLC